MRSGFQRNIYLFIYLFIRIPNAPASAECRGNKPHTSLLRSEGLSMSPLCPLPLSFTKDDERLCCLDLLECYQITAPSIGSVWERTDQAFRRAPDQGTVGQSVKGKQRERCVNVPPTTAVAAVTAGSARVPTYCQRARAHTLWRHK
jgi:hypothetical protein